MMNSAARWSLKCFDIPISELDEYVHENSQNDFIFVQYSYKELGRSEAWLEKQRRAIGDLTTLKREVLLEWPRSMDSSVFNEEQLDKVFKFIKPVVCSILVRNKYPVNFFENPDLNTNYILSCDVSGGLSSDNSVITIIHPEDFRVVGEFKNAKIDTDAFRSLIEDLMTFYMPNSLLVIEKTGIGLPLIDTLMKNPQIEPRMYRETKERPAEKTQTNGFTVKRKTKTIVYGVDTVKQTRDQMIDLLFDIVENEYDKFVSENIYHDLVTLERKKNGKIEHASGAHDDNLMSYLIFRWAVFYGTCFRDRFGISSIPSKYNVKVVSSQENFSKISSIIESANKADAVASGFAGNPIYEALEIQQRRLQEDEFDSKTKQVNAFMNIMKFNNE